MSSKQYTAREIESIIKSDGWYLVEITGSHHHYKHRTKPGKVTIPFRSKPKTLSQMEVHSIFKQAQLDKRLFL